MQQPPEQASASPQQAMEPEQEERKEEPDTQGRTSAAGLSPLHSNSGADVTRILSTASSLPASRASGRSRRATAQTEASLGDWWQEEEESGVRSRAITTVTEYDYDAGMTKTRTLREDDAESQGATPSNPVARVSLFGGTREQSSGRPSGGDDSPRPPAEMPRPLLTATEEGRSGARRDAGADSESDYATLCSELRSLKMELARIKSERSENGEEKRLRSPAQKAAHKAPPQKQPEFWDASCACFRNKRQGRDQGQGQEIMGQKDDGATSSSSWEQRLAETPTYEPNATGVHGQALTDMVSSFFKDVLGSEDEDLKRSTSKLAAMERSRW